jgi:hypothetical protein
VVDAQRQADDRNDRTRRGRLGDRAERRFAAVEQRALVEQVVAGVGRQAELRERDQHGALLGRLRSSATDSAALKTGSATRILGTATETRAKPWLYGFRNESA